MKRFIPHILFVVLVAGLAWGSAIKVWTTGETLRAADLNANFTHIHTTKVGDGTLLVNADVSASAAISHSKLATPSLIPKAKANVNGGSVGTSCAASPCTVTEGVGVASVTRAGAGDYVVTLSAPGADAAYVVQLTIARDGSDGNCVFAVNTASNFGVKCYDAAAAPADRTWNIVLWDN